MQPAYPTQNTEIQNNQGYTVVFILAAAVVAMIAGGVSAFCIARGGNVDWSVKFWVLVKVACRFN